MLNIIWCLFILVSVLFSIMSGNFENVNNSIFSSIQNTVELCIRLLGGICFWNGIINIITNTSLQDKIKKMISPINKFLFPNVNQNSKAYEYMSINMVTNLLGLGNAATPAGINAVSELNKFTRKESKELSDEMLMFLAINTASLQIIPTNVIAIRSSLGSKNPGGIILGVWVSSIITFIFITLATKIYIKVRKKSY